MASFGRILWKWTAGVFAVLAIALALLFGVFRIAVSHAPEYRQPIEVRASAAIGLPVTLGRVDARLGLSGPEVLLEDVTVLSEAGGSPLLEADRVSVSLDVSELLLRWRVRWDQVTLDGIVLDIVREPDGALRILGRRLDELPAPDPSRKLPVDELRLQNSRVVFEDRAPADPAGGPVTWRFEDVHLGISSRREGLRLSGDFLPPRSAGERVVFSADRAAGADRWEAFAASGGIEFGALTRVRELDGIVPARGRASLRVWLEGTGASPTAVKAEFDLEDVVLPGDRESASHPGAPGATEPPGVDYDALGGRLEWTRTPRGWEARLDDLDLRRGTSSWRLAALTASSGVEPLTGRRQVEAAADYLRLDDLRPLVRWLPDETLRGHVETMAPGGEIHDLAVELVAGGDDPEARPALTVQAHLEEVTFRPSGPVPGVKGLTGNLRGDPRGGRFEFGGGGAEVELPSLFREPIALERAEGLLLWNVGSDGVLLVGDGLVLANSDLELDTGFRVRLADDSQPGRIDLQGEITGLDVVNVGPYLPVGIMKPKLVAWLDEALDAGQVPRADVRIAGPLRGFPYREDEGEFRVEFKAHGLDLDYRSGWPVATGLTAEIVFENEGMTATITEGELSGLTVGAVRAGFEDLLTGELTVDGDMAGPLPGVLKYLVDAEPIRRMLGPALTDLEIEAGDARVRADLLLPLKDLPRRRVNVDVAFQRGMLAFEGLVFELTDLAGELRVRDDEAFGDAITARLLEQPVWIDVAPFQDQGVRASLRIQTTSEALLESLALPLDAYISGATEITGILQFPRPGRGQRFWTRFESDLEGLAVTLPEPLAKTAAERVTYVHDIRFPEPGRQEWAMRLGDDILANATLSTAEGRLRFLRATVQGGDTPVVPHEGNGLFVRGQFDAVSVDDWLALKLGGEPNDEPVRFESFFAGVDARVADLRVISQHVADVAVTMKPAQDAWQIVVDSETVAGEVTVPFDLAGRSRPIELDMSRLTLFDEERDGSGEDGDPAAIPPLRILAEDFRSHAIRFGRVETRVDPLPDGIDVPSFNATGPSSTLTGSLRSQLGSGIDRSTLSLSLKSTDLASTLEYAGFAPAVAADDVEFAADLAWQGGLVSDLLAVAEGSARLRLGSGRLTEVKPGAGRVFGLLSVQALPRRLMLDFRDVFEKGFFFDRFSGDFKIANGQASTDNLAMEGRAADIGIIGSIDLVQRQYDQTAVVSAQLGNTLPLVGAIAAGPIIGGGLFILKEILKQPLREAGQVQYRITGPWENPVVAKVSSNNGGKTQVSRGKGESEPGGG